MDYRPISLCNILYKITSKIIVVQLRNVLSIHLTPKQHGFLKDRKILEDVALTQECLHSMHSRKIDTALLKIDLKKAQDCIDWGFIRCLLAKIGLDGKCSSWIMACVVDVNYTVLINGIPTPFFMAARGLRQGCSLSQLLFIVVMDSLSLHIKRAIHERDVVHSLLSTAFPYIIVYLLMTSFYCRCFAKHHGYVYMKF